MNINYTYYLKLMDILEEEKKVRKSHIKKEQENLDEKSKDSMWGLTNSQKCYLELLHNILRAGDSFFSTKKIEKIKNDIKNNFDYKIRVVFFCHEFQTFSSFISIYNKLKNDNHFICKLVHIPFFHVDKAYDKEEELNEYKKNGYHEIIEAEDYQLTSENPDVAFFLKPYDLIPKEFYIDEIEKVIEKSIYIPYGMEIGATKESMRYQFQLPLHEKAWYCISYCTKHYKNACCYSKQKGRNYLMIGHPRMDLVNLDLSNEKETKKIKQLIKNRPIFMYNPHFTIKDGEDNWGSFKTYGMDILNYFSKHKELFLIYRPHPFLEGALKEEYDSVFLENYNKLLQKNKDNIYLDKSGNYLIAMHLADYLISDANSFVPEFLTYNKPVIYTKKHNTTGFNNPDLEKMLYICEKKEDIFENIRMVMENDYKGKNRVNDIKKVFNFDKEDSVSSKIINILKEYYK